MPSPHRWVNEPRVGLMQTAFCLFLVLALGVMQEALGELQTDPVHGGLVGEELLDSWLPVLGDTDSVAGLLEADLDAVLGEELVFLGEGAGHPLDRDLDEAMVACRIPADEFLEGEAVAPVGAFDEVFGRFLLH